MLLESPTNLTSPALILTSPESPFSLAPALILPVSTFPVSLVTVMLPPSAFLELGLELRSRVIMSPSASRAMRPPWVVRGVLTPRLLAA